jgi:hypothetical protein
MTSCQVIPSVVIFVLFILDPEQVMEVGYKRESSRTTCK